MADRTFTTLLDADGHVRTADAPGARDIRVAPGGQIDVPHAGRP